MVVRDVAEEPHSREDGAVRCGDRSAETVEDAAVGQLELVTALLLRMVVDVRDPRAKAIGVGEPADDGGDRSVVRAVVDDVGRDPPHLDEALVEREDPPVGRDDEDPVRGRLGERFEQTAPEFAVGRIENERQVLHPLRTPWRLDDRSE
jgi:hypothetical protein